jgi:hypothetical protein
MKRIWIVLLICIMPFIGRAQDNSQAKHKHKHKSKTATKATKVPEWAAAHNYDATAYVYFPDYYTFYDPARGGYVFWENGKWSFTPSVPAYLEKVDLGKSRIQILKGLSLDLHPQLDYPHYMKLYPAEHPNNMVPVPIPGNPAGN